ncbi:MAG: beta-eliminating lyase-related protein [Clostridia bacterium]|nr:beta-eliminating lyase-related protein [Clostridia bacterium]
MLSFESDYTTGAHEKILQRLCQTNLVTVPGYGADPFCASAKEKIRLACALPEAQVELLVGGTQTNAVVISTMLREYEGVFAAQTGHVNAHEAGAIEYTGHKVLALPQKNGKFTASDLQQALVLFHGDNAREHMVWPGMVYLSYPTEYGTLYSKQELSEIRAVCDEYRLPLFIDGARLGYGLMSRECDLTLPELCRLADVIYIGGTKVGALCGEAVVFTKNNRPEHFENRIKKRGALLAKGRLLGVQFDTLFTDGLYFDISRHAIDMTEQMKDIFRAKGYRFFLDSPTNQQFIILPNERMEALKPHVRFSFWETYDENHTVVRFACSWSTTEADLKALEALL